MKTILKNIFKLLAIVTIIVQIVFLFLPIEPVWQLVISIFPFVFEIAAGILEIEIKKTKTDKSSGDKKVIPLSSLILSLIMLCLAAVIVDVLIGTILVVISFVVSFILYNSYHKRGLDTKISPLQRFFIILALIILPIAQCIKLVLTIPEKNRIPAFVLLGIQFALYLIATIIIIICLRKKSNPMRYLLVFFVNSLGTFFLYLLNGVGAFGLITINIPFALPSIFSSIISLAAVPILYILGRLPINIVEKSYSKEIEKPDKDNSYDNSYQNTYIK